MRRATSAAAVALALAASPGAAQTEADAPHGSVDGLTFGIWAEDRMTPEVPYVQTAPAVVDAMLGLARLRPGDVVYDLGCGDGRIVNAAVRHPGVRGVGIDIDPRRVAEASRSAAASGLSDRVSFRKEDIFESDFRDATVVMLYLLPEVNVRLRPRLLSQLAPGARIVSNSFGMGAWTPDERVAVDGHPVFLWIVPADRAGLLARLAREERQGRADGAAGRR